MGRHNDSVHSAKVYAVQLSEYKGYISQLSRLDFYTGSPYCKGKSNLAVSQMRNFNYNAGRAVSKERFTTHVNTVVTKGKSLLKIQWCGGRWSFSDVTADIFIIEKQIVTFLAMFCEK